MTTKTRRLSDDRFRVRRERLYYYINERLRDLGLIDKLPSDRTPPSIGVTLFNVTIPRYDHIHDHPPIGTYHVTVMPNENIGRWKSSQHRVFINCDCGKGIPFGRLHQHKPACKGKPQ